MKIPKILWVVLLVVVVVVGIRLYRQSRSPGGQPVFPNISKGELVNSGEESGGEWKLEVFAEGLGGPRDLIRDPRGNLVVSIPGRDRVVALLDENQDGKAEKTVNIAEDLNSPHGLAFKCDEGNKACKIFIAETDQVAVYDYDLENLQAVNKKKIVDLPGGGNHYSRSLLLITEAGVDKLLISIGSTCNVCNEADDRRAKILVANLDGSGLEEYAKGLRNSVFMAIHPVTGKTWATEMGRDQLGDDIPPDEINIVEKGKNYGWPICYGKNIHDTSFDKNTYIRNPCTEPFETPSHIDIQAHSAPLGLAFIPEDGWPEEYHHNLLVAYHGSWNRSEKTGYKVVRYRLDEKGNYLGEEDFLNGWLDEKENVSGRPVDILADPGGVVYISDDKGGRIYRAELH